MVLLLELNAVRVGNYTFSLGGFRTGFLFVVPFKLLGAGISLLLLGFCSDKDSSQEFG